MIYRVEVKGNDEVGYSAYLPELPGCVAAGETFEETKELIAEAVGLHLELMEAEGLPFLNRRPWSLSWCLKCHLSRKTLPQLRRIPGALSTLVSSRAESQLSDFCPCGLVKCNAGPWPRRTSYGLPDV